MGQEFIIEWLKLQRINGSNEYYSIPDIVKAMKQYALPNGGSITRQVNKLYSTGFLEIKVKVKIDMYHHRRFRLKHKYCYHACFFKLVEEYHSVKNTP